MVCRRSYYQVGSSLCIFQFHQDSTKKCFFKLNNVQETHKEAQLKSKNVSKIYVKDRKCIAPHNNTKNAKSPQRIGIFSIAMANSYVHKFLEKFYSFICIMFNSSLYLESKTKPTERVIRSWLKHLTT